MQDFNIEILSKLFRGFYIIYNICYNCNILIEYDKGDGFLSQLTNFYNKYYNQIKC